jgi:hypothetical protein
MAGAVIAAMALTCLLPKDQSPIARVVNVFK